MEKHRIKNLQNELNRLTERFNENMKRISLLLDFTKGKDVESSDLRQMISLDKAISERLELIKENFQINWDRVDILRKLKSSQEEYCTNPNIPESKDKKTICCPDFFENWRLDYLEKGDFLMVEIIDILND